MLQLIDQKCHNTPIAQATMSAQQWQTREHIATGDDRETSGVGSRILSRSAIITSRANTHYIHKHHNHNHSGLASLQSKQTESEIAESAPSCG